MTTETKEQEHKYPQPVGDWKVVVYGKYQDHSYEVRGRDFDDNTTLYQTTVAVDKLKSHKDEQTLFDMADYLNHTWTTYGEPKKEDWINGQIPLDRKMVVTYLVSYDDKDPKKIQEYQMDKMHEFIESWIACFVKKGRVCRE